MIVPDPDPMPTPPDLQKLVEQYGGYHRIPGEQWVKYDAQLARTQAWLLIHHVQRKASDK